MRVFVIFMFMCKKKNRYCIVECVNKVYLYPYLSMRLVFLISVKMGLSQFSSDNIHNVRRLSISRQNKPFPPFLLVSYLPALHFSIYMLLFIMDDGGPRNNRLQDFRTAKALSPPNRIRWILRIFCWSVMWKCPIRSGQIHCMV